MSSSTSSSSDDDAHPNLILELCSLVFTLLRFPHLVAAGPSSFPPSPSHCRISPTAARPMPPMTPAAFASLLLGASLALMVCGSVTFVIGFILMPWVLGIVMVFYFLGIVSNITGFWMALLCPIRKEISGFK